MNSYIFNLHDGIGDQEQKQLFAPFGVVTSTHVAIDAISGGSRSFDQVEIEDAVVAQKAIDHLNGTELQTLTIYAEETGR